MKEHLFHSEQKPMKDVILIGSHGHTMATTQEKIERIVTLLEEKGQDKDRFLELLQKVLERGSSKEIDALLRVLSDEESLQALSTLTAVREEAEREEEVEERSPAFQEKLRSRSDSSEADIKAGRTISLEEAGRRNEEFIRKHYEG